MNSPDPATPIHVLCVDTDALAARALAAMLTGEADGGFEVSCVTDFEDGLDRLATRGADVLLIDSTLLATPDVLGRLTAQAPHVPLVVLGSSDEEEAACHALRSGAQEFVVRSHCDHRLLPLVVRHAIARHEIARERARSEEALRSFQKFEAIGRLAGGIAHDFNNLLTVISGRVELVLPDLPASPMRASMLEIQQAAHRAARLVHQLLAFSRQQVMTPVASDLNELIRNIEPLMRSLLGEDVELSVHLAESPVVSSLDPGQFEQILMNLAANARDAMPDGGRFSIETADIDLGGDLSRRYASIRPGRHVRVRVADTGHGMDEATRARAFEPFFSTKAEAGTGLGLATVYGIVKQSGGHIWIESAPLRGTTFDVYFPATPGCPQVSSRGARSVEAPGGTERVLLVEDEGAARRLFRTVLERQGYEVVEAPNGPSALGLAEQRGPFDILVTDLVMPKLGGRQLAEQLRRRQPSLRVLYLSGYSREAILAEGKLSPESDFLGKPFTPEELTGRVRAVLDRGGREGVGSPVPSSGQAAPPPFPGAAFRASRAEESGIG